MVSNTITLLCYWNGKLSQDEQGIAYENAIPKAIKVNRGIKHRELAEKMLKLTMTDPHQYTLNIVCRYFANDKYIALSIDDNESVDIMLDMTKERGMNCVELYLEMTPLLFGNQSNLCSTMNDGPFTRLLREEIDTNDPLLFGMSNEPVSLPPPIPPYSDEGTSTGFESNTNKKRRSNEPDEPHFNLHFTGIREAMETEDYACVVEGTDINNDLVEDETEENLHEIDKTCESYREAPVPEFTNIDQGDTVTFSNWVPWVEKIAPENNDQEFYIGQHFGTKQELQAAAKLYSLKSHQEYKVVESSPTVLSLKCKQGVSCSWKLRAPVPKGAAHFQVKRYKGPHTCVNPIMSRHHKQLDSEFIVSRIMKVVKAQTSLTPAAIQALISDDVKYDITYKKAWQAKMKTIKEIFGDWKESYRLLPRYMDALQRQNPGTVVVWQKDQVSHSNVEIFKRVFWAFGPSIEGFKYCRPVISIDGTHLYGKYKGTMLIAMSCDANNQLFPLAFAIVESENNDSWGWFMSCIRDRVTNRKDLCVISDRHIGILNAMRSPYLGWDEPNAHHRVCIRHLASNFNSKFHDTSLKNLLVRTARSNQIHKFNLRKEKIFKMNPDAEAWLSNIPEKMWALAHDGGRRYGVMTTNLSEVFNSVLLGARSLPITACVECTFHRLNKYFSVRRQLAEERTKQLAMFPPNIDKILLKNAEKANKHEVMLFDHVMGLFRIKTGRSVGNINKGGHIQVVNLREKTCTCQKWQLYGLPCSHVIAACMYRKLDYRNFVHHWYSISNYSKTWSPCFRPVLDEGCWPPESGPIMVPDERLKRSKRGRPQSTRLHNEMDIKEGHGQIACTLCRKKGHNKRTCPTKSQ